MARQVEAFEPAIEAYGPARSAFLRDITRSFRMMNREGQGGAVPYAERVRGPDPGACRGQRIPAQQEQPWNRSCAPSSSRPAILTTLPVRSPSGARPSAPVAPASRRLPAEPLERARSLTNEKVITLPPGHHLTLTFVKNVDYRGYSDYAAKYSGQVWLNAELDWEVPGVKHLVCHEAFPGHQAFSATRSGFTGPESCR